MVMDRSGQGSGEPAIAGFTIGPSDAQYLPYVTRALYVGNAGNIAVLMFDGSIIVFTNAVAGTILPIRVVKIFNTGTTASNLVGLF
jgi:hypothetical protein